MNRHMHFRRAVLVALLAGAVSCDGRARALASLRGIVLSPAHAKPDFTLDDTNGRPFHFRADSRDMVTLLYFGYTNCPDVCPTHLNNIAAALRTMPAADRARVRVVFVTTDPVRDTPQRLRTWLDTFSPSFIGLRGDPDEVNRIATSLGLPPAVLDVMAPMKPGTPMTYTVGHAAQVLGFTPDDSLRVEYDASTTRDDWLNDLPRLVKIR